MPVSTVSRQVAELERQLRVTLLERSTRKLRLTDVGAQVFEHARRSVDLSDAVGDLAGTYDSVVSGVIHLSSPPSISDSLLAPLIDEFQRIHPQVRVQVIVTDRFVDLMAEGVDVAFIVGPLAGATLVSTPILSYRHQVVASPEYLAHRPPITRPEDLLEHPLYAFSFWTPDNTWTFTHAGNGEHVAVRFKPHLSINDYHGIIPALLGGRGVGELPPVVRGDLLRERRLIEVIPQWHLPVFDFKVVHVANRYIPRAVRAFIESVTVKAPLLFSGLPT